MPTVAFHDLLIHPRDNDLIAATHGRGIWILDDISALQQATPTVLAGDAQLFTTRPATRWLRIQRGGYGRGDLYFKGENPPTGGVGPLLHEGPRVPATIEITDGDQLKTTFLVDDAKAGINRITWDLRWDPSASHGPDDGDQPQVADRRGAEADRSQARAEGRARERPATAREVRDELPEVSRTSRARWRI